MRFSYASLALAAIASMLQSEASPIDMEERAATSPVDPIFRPASQLCEAATGVLEVITRPLTVDLTSLGLKRETLNPAIPVVGRKYEVVAGSRGQIARGGDAFYPIGTNVGPCLVLSFGGSYFNALVITGNPSRLLFPISAVGDDFGKATTVCQAACDNYIRFQSVLAGGAARCNAINPWLSVPPKGDPFAAFGGFVICDMYPDALSTSSVKLPTPGYVSNGVLANAKQSLL